MSKRYFSRKSRWEPRLFIIIGVITGLLALSLGAQHFLSRARASLPVLGGGTGGATLKTLEQAYMLVEQGTYDEAERMLRPLLRGRDPVLTPRAIILQADIEHFRGNEERALDLLSNAYDTFRSSPEYPYIAARKARQLEEMKRDFEARAIHESLRDNAPPEMRAMGHVGLARLAERDGDLILARDLYQHAVADALWGGTIWDDAVNALGRLNVTLIFSPQETPESRYYVVEPGDTLITIGMKLNTTQGLLMTANNIDDPGRLRLGQRLKYTPKDFKIVIERSTCTLYLLDNRGLFKRYAVGLGMAGHETTLGRYTIGNKQKDPTWFKPGSEPIPPGHPDNELGTRWMPMIPAEEGLPHDLGIHGTIAPETIGTFASRGCARMHRDDVEELYDLVVRGTPVEVVEVFSPETEDAAPATVAHSAETLSQRI